MTAVRIIKNGTRICVACNNTDARCTCDNEQHKEYITRFFGERHGKAESRGKVQGQGSYRQDRKGQEVRRLVSAA